MTLVVLFHCCKSQTFRA